MPDAFITLVSVQPSASANSIKGEKFQNRPQACGQGPGALYEARRQKAIIRAKWADGASAPAPGVAGRRPYIVEEITATALPSPSHVVRLTWKAQDRCTYVIRIGTTPIFDLATWATRTEGMAPDGTLTITWDHADATPGTTYYYVVQAKNLYGDGHYSEPPVFATTPLDPPAPPQHVAAYAYVRNAATAWWDNSAGATSYALYWKTSPGVTKDDTRVHPVTAPVLIPRPGGGPFYARIAAIGPAGEGALSKESGVTVLP